MSKLCASRRSFSKSTKTRRRGGTLSKLLASCSTQLRLELSCRRLCSSTPRRAFLFQLTGLRRMILSPKKSSRGRMKQKLKSWLTIRLRGSGSLTTMSKKNGESHSASFKMVIRTKFWLSMRQKILSSCSCIVT